eukprot:13439086-Alexandrium_andersonii.AAC.1
MALADVACPKPAKRLASPFAAHAACFPHDAFEADSIIERIRSEQATAIETIVAPLGDAFFSGKEWLRGQ